MRPCLALLVLMIIPLAWVAAEYGHMTTEGDFVRTDGVNVSTEGGDHMRTEGDYVRTEGDYVRAEGVNVRTEGAHIRAEGDGVRVGSEGGSDPCSSSACERIDSRLVSRHHYRNIVNRDGAILLTSSKHVLFFLHKIEI